MKKLIFNVTLLFISVFICSFESQSASEFINIKAEAKSLEPLYGIEINSNSIVFTVSSNGCTRSKHFELEASRASGDQISISLIRKKPDLCRALPWLINVKMPIPFLNLQDPKFIMINPFKNKRSINPVYMK